MENLTSSDLRRARLVVPQEGANVEVIDPETGEVIAKVGFSGGVHSIAMLAQHFPPGSEFRPSGAVFAMRDAERAVVMRGPSNESGANADYQPRRLSDGEALLHRMVRGLQDKINGMDKRAKTMERKTARQLAKEEEPVLVDETDEPVEIEDAPGKSEQKPAAE